MTRHVKLRLQRFKEFKPDGCICMSYYDFIRVYDKKQLLEFQEYIELPQEFIEEVINNPADDNDDENNYYSRIIKASPFYNTVRLLDDDDSSIKICNIDLQTFCSYTPFHSLSSIVLNYLLQNDIRALSCCKDIPLEFIRKNSYLKIHI